VKHQKPLKPLSEPRWSVKNLKSHAKEVNL